MTGAGVMQLTGEWLGRLTGSTAVSIFILQSANLSFGWSWRSGVIGKKTYMFAWFDSAPEPGREWDHIWVVSGSKGSEQLGGNGESERPNSGSEESRQPSGKMIVGAMHLSGCPKFK